MNLRPITLLLLWLFSASQLAAQTTSNIPKFSLPARTFRFTYSFTVKDIPPEAKQLRVWVPVAQTDRHQTVRIPAIKAPTKRRMTVETGYGNRMMYAEFHNPAGAKLSSQSGTSSRAANIREAISATRARRPDTQRRVHVDAPIACA